MITNKDSLRRVTVTRTWYETINGREVSRKGNVPGFFHTWGMTYEEFEAGPGNCSIAIIEYLDGTVETVLPNQIKFNHPPKIALEKEECSFDYESHGMAKNDCDNCTFKKPFLEVQK